jgi:hypothetical protein
MQNTRKGIKLKINDTRIIVFSKKKRKILEKEKGKVQNKVNKSEYRRKIKERGTHENNEREGSES